MTLAVITAHAGADTLETAIASWDWPWTIVMDGTQGMMKAYDQAWREHDYDVLAYFHDDLILKGPWAWSWRVMKELDDPSVGLVGFGGALRHGRDDLYKTPYDYRQLGRVDYLSNTDDAEVHGTRFEGACDVAVLDGFALIVRRAILEKAGGWPLDTPIGYSLYDYWLSCETRRQGYRIRLLGLPCVHLGGRTAVALGKANGSGDAHEKAHRYIYDTCRDVLPVRVPPVTSPDSQLFKVKA